MHVWSDDDGRSELLSGRQPCPVGLSFAPAGRGLSVGQSDVATRRFRLIVDSVERKSLFIGVVVCGIQPFAIGRPRSARTRPAVHHYSLSRPRLDPDELMEPIAVIPQELRHNSNENSKGNNCTVSSLVVMSSYVKSLVYVLCACLYIYMYVWCALYIYIYIYFI